MDLGNLNKVWEVGEQTLSLEHSIETLPAVLPVSAIGILNGALPNQRDKGSKELA